MEKKDKQNLSQREDVSKLLSKTIMPLCTSEVRCLFYGLTDMHTAIQCLYDKAFKQKKWPKTHYSGSHADGVLNFNDIDLLNLLPVIEVFDSDEDIHSGECPPNHLYINTKKCLPWVPKLDTTWPDT